METVAVIGLGYGGHHAAKDIAKSCGTNLRVIGINATPYLFHNVAVLRGLCDPSGWGDKIAIPLDKMFQGTANAAQHQLLVARVREIVPDTQSKCGFTIHFEQGGSASGGVGAEGGGEQGGGASSASSSIAPLSPDYLVLATGSSYGFPCKFSSASSTSTTPSPLSIQSMLAGEQGHAALVKANSIGIIGGGAVGVELAGEIRHFFPSKKVTLLHSQPALVSGSGLSSSFQSSVLSAVRKMGIDTILGERVLLSPADTEQIARGERVFVGERELETSGGKKVSVDLLYFCVGTHVNSEIFRTALSSVVTEQGRLRVNEYLQVQGQERVFALGDCAEIEAMMGYLSGLQAAVLAQNVCRLAKKQSLKKYSRSNPTMMVSLGPSRGVGQLPVMSMVVGDWVVPSVKSKDLFVSHYWGGLNVKPPK